MKPLTRFLVVIILLFTAAGIFVQVWSTRTYALEVAVDLPHAADNLIYFPSGTEEEGVLLIKRTLDYRTLVDKYGFDQVSVVAINLHERGETEFLARISDGFLMQPGCIIVLEADSDEGYVYQLDEELNIVFWLTLSKFEEGARNVDALKMVQFYSSLK